MKEIILFETKKLLKTAIVSFAPIVMANYAQASSYDCKVMSNGYSMALSGASGNLQRQLEIVKSWMPEALSVTPRAITFNRKNTFDVIGGDREKTFVIKRNAKTSSNKIYKLTYRLNIDKYNGTGSFYMEQTGFKRLGPVRYNCGETSSKSASSNVKSDNLRIQFNKLNMCNRRYLQQFLKGLGLYAGGIDAKWGKGTRAGVVQAMKLPKFNGKSSEYFFDKIKENPLC